MINPTFDNILLCDYGSFNLSGESSVSVRQYPRSKGVLIFPTKKKNGTISLKCAIVRKGNMDTKEDLQHKLLERLLSSGSGTLGIEGISIENCCPKNASFSKCNDRVLEYEITFDIGLQVSYSNGIKFNQLSPMPVLRDYRTGTFVSNGRTFTFGHQVEQLKSATYMTKNLLDYRWSNEYRKITEGGQEVISVNGWLNNIAKSKGLVYIYNMIFGPLGQLGTLTVGSDSTADVIMTSVGMEDMNTNNLVWNASFVTTLKC